MGSLFSSHPFDLPKGFDDRSIHIFLLVTGEPEEDLSRALEDEIAAANLAGVGPGRQPARPPRPKGERFQPNVVITREKGDQPLREFALKKRKKLAAPKSKASVLREGPREIAGRPGYETEVLLAVEKPPVELIQWQVVTSRDGDLYCFFATTTRARWERDKPQFEALLKAWR